MTLKAAGKQCQIVGPLNPSAVIGRSPRTFVLHPLSNFAPSLSFLAALETGFLLRSNKVLQDVRTEWGPSDRSNICARASLFHPWLVCLLKNTITTG
jgi:hypothetical protein